MTHSLKPWNTFGIDHCAKHIVCAENEQQLLSAWQQATREGLPVMILGEGSNVLFLENYAGTVILNRLKGIEVNETADAWHLHVGAGENWHQLVRYALDNNMPGLENLALIPGCVGSSPIQNIGAYGVELQRVCDYVDCVELETGKRLRLSAAECRFGYRDSIFKNEYQDRVAIVAVGLRLSKQWQPVLTYGDLTRLDPKTVTAQQVFDAVCHMRTTKLPDPKVNGNAGSFLKSRCRSRYRYGTVRTISQRAALPSGRRLSKAGGRLADRSMSVERRHHWRRCGASPTGAGID